MERNFCGCLGSYAENTTAKRREARIDWSVTKKDRGLGGKDRRNSRTEGGIIDLKVVRAASFDWRRWWTSLVTGWIATSREARIDWLVTKKDRGLGKKNRVIGGKDKRND